MLNHTVKCLNLDCPGGEIQTSMEGDRGYSNWSVTDSGYIEFKCHGCGKFSSTDTDKKPNEPNNFEVKCNNCGSIEWDYEIQDCDAEEEETHIYCKNCKVKSI